MVQAIAPVRRGIAILTLLGMAALCVAGAKAIAPEILRDLAFGENDAKVVAIAGLVAAAEADGLVVLQGLLNGEVQTSGQQVLQVRNDTAVDLASRRRGAVGRA